MHWCVSARVIDNWGDIGFAWRLARALHGRGERVRLVVDDDRALDWMAPGRAGEPRVERWPGALAEPVDIAVETFGCGLPDGVQADVFVNVEHLTAEPYAARSHGLPSPVDGRTVWFFFPGFDADTGGLLGPPIARAEGRPDRDRDRDRDHEHDRDRVVTAFGYPGACWQRLLDALGADGIPTRVLALPGGATDGLRALAAPTSSVRVEPIGFQSQDGYDRLLADADLNLVRGEDSLVRAVRAGRPFLWQAYVQADGAHVAKVRAFVDRYARDAEPALRDALHATFAVWNGFAAPDAPLRLPPADAWSAHATAVSEALAREPDLAERLIAFASLRWRALPSSAPP